MGKDGMEMGPHLTNAEVLGPLLEERVDHPLLLHLLHGEGGRRNLHIILYKNIQ
jgi:hypothetical protein